MKKSILSLGKTLNKAEQKSINGGKEGGLGPCGLTGGEYVLPIHCQMGYYETYWYNGGCIACY